MLDPQHARGLPTYQRDQPAIPNVCWLKSDYYSQNMTSTPYGRASAIMGPGGTIGMNLTAKVENAPPLKGDSWASIPADIKLPT